MARRARPRPKPGAVWTEGTPPRGPSGKARVIYGTNPRRPVVDDHQLKSGETILRDQEKLRVARVKAQKARFAALDKEVKKEDRARMAEAKRKAAGEARAAAESKSADELAQLKANPRPRMKDVQRIRELEGRLKSGGQEAGRRIGALRNQLAASERELADLRARGQNTSGLEQQIASLRQEMTVNIQAIQSGRVALGPDGRPVQMVTYGAGGAGISPELRGVLTEAQFERLVEAIQGKQGGTQAQARNALLEDIEAMQKGGMSAEDIKKVINKREGIEEENPKKGTAKFASDAENVAKGVGNINVGIGNLFSTGAFANILMVIVIILMIWIVLRVFFPMVP